MHNGGNWTEARFHSFIKGGLRKLSQRWPPKHEVMKKARIERGVYKCVGYKKRWHKVRHKDGVFVDHIIPVIDPKKGFVSWDDTIERLFCEEEGLQVLCKECHDRKTADERKKR
jgi:hypothetical protein